MLADGGSFEAQDSSGVDIAKAWDAKAAVSFEALMLPEKFEGFGTAKVGLGNILRSRNLCLAVKDGLLLAKAGPGPVLKSKVALPAVPFHLVAVKQGDKLTAFINGKNVEWISEDGALKDTAEADAVTFGGNWGGGLLHVALYGRALGLDEISRNAGASLQRAAQFPAPPHRVALRAKLAESSTPPQVEAIVPYTGSLVACMYEVQQVVSGEFKEKRILVNHWGLLNRQPVAGFPREVGKVYDLTVEKQSDHPELRGERVTDDTTAFDMEPWFDVTTPQMK
jgi:hypothetical protein